MSDLLNHPVTDSLDWLNREQLRRQFWAGLLARCRDRSSLFADHQPRTDYWLRASTGVAGVSLGFVLGMHHAEVDLYIDTGDQTRNTDIFDALAAQRQQIEAQFGAPLTWSRLDAKRACVISYRVAQNGLMKRESWLVTQDGMIDALLDLHRAVQPALEHIT